MWLMSRCQPPGKQNPLAEAPNQPALWSSPLPDQTHLLDFEGHQRSPPRSAGQANPPQSLEESLPGSSTPSSMPPGHQHQRPPRHRHCPRFWVGTRTLPAARRELAGSEAQHGGTGRGSPRSRDAPSRRWPGPRTISSPSAPQLLGWLKRLEKSGFRGPFQE